MKKNVILVFLPLFLVLCSFELPKTTISLVDISSCGCGEHEDITIDDVIALDPEGYEDWVERSGFLDGTYYESTVVFSDGTKGKLFRGGNSGKYFVEDSSGANYYYAGLRSAIRALYLYKKYGCLSDKYKL